MKCDRHDCDFRAVAGGTFCHHHLAPRPIERLPIDGHRELTGAPPLLEEFAIVFVVALVAIAGIGVWHDTPPASPELEHCRADLARLEQRAGQYATVIAAGLNGWPITDGERSFYITEARRR